MKQLKTWLASDTPYIWLNAGAVTVSLVMVLGLFLLVAVKGFGHFWPSRVAQIQYQPDAATAMQTVVGEIVDKELIPVMTADADAAEHNLTRYLIKTGNRDLLGIDFRWIQEKNIRRISYPAAAVVIERREWGNFYGFLPTFKEAGAKTQVGQQQWDEHSKAIENSNRIFDQIHHIEKDLIGGINYQMERLRLKERRLELAGIEHGPEWRTIRQRRDQLQSEYDSYAAQLAALYTDLNKGNFAVALADGTRHQIPLTNIVRAYQPNNMRTIDKWIFYLEKIWEFVSTDPREANTEGGIFPAIFGTVLMVMIMAIMVTPLGVITAVYLREYAKQGLLTRLIRVAVNNLAGVPSIVYGVFGLGFFIYFLGGSIDKLFFPEALPTPTFGTPGLLWASLTLAILTMPVVIVATEEGLSRVPIAVREGSLALGATKAQTLWRIVLPMTAPAMITGLILAVARAAGEVAPLMLVGAVKLAPSLPLDGNSPFLHLDRKFMHLGFHIYDVGFQSPNVEAARPLVYATALLLILIIIVLNLTAIKIRNNLRERYHEAE